MVALCGLLISKKVFIAHDKKNHKHVCIDGCEKTFKNEKDQLYHQLIHHYSLPLVASFPYFFCNICFKVFKESEGRGVAALVEMAAPVDVAEPLELAALVDVAASVEFGSIRWRERVFTEADAEGDGAASPAVLETSVRQAAAGGGVVG